MFRRLSISSWKFFLSGNGMTIRTGRYFGRAAVLGANFDATDPVGAAAKGGRAAAIVLEEEPEDRL